MSKALILNKSVGFVGHLAISQSVDENTGMDTPNLGPSTTAHSESHSAASRSDERPWLTSEPRSLTLRRIVIFSLFAFGLAWALWFGVLYPTVFSSSTGLGPLTTLILGAGMFAPALAVVITRLLTGEGWARAWIRPQELKRTWTYYLLAWFAPLVAIVAGAFLYFAIFPQEFDPSSSFFVEMQRQALRGAVPQNALSDDQLRAAVWGQLPLVALAPLVNFLPCFGEEWGWRGYLLPKLREVFSMPATLLISGVVWGLWHAPVIAIGHNYGTEYATYPIGGILAMCVFTTLVGAFMSYVTLRSGSVIPAVLAHGMLNGAAAFGLLFSASAGNPFTGPLPTGVIGGVGLILLGIVSFVLLLRYSPADPGSLN